MTFARRPGPVGRFNRRGLASGGGWRPTMLSGCVLWLRADLGITTVDAAALDPNDVSTGNWLSASGLSARTATTITDTNDGAPTLHYVTQTTSGMQANHNATLTVELKAGTKTWAWVACSFGVTAYLNLTTGALGTVTGGSAVVTDMGSGWWKIDLSGTTNGVPIAVGTANGDGGVSYQGNGTGTVQMRNFVVTQRNVSAWADQSGSGNHFSQGTAAQQPEYTDGALNGKPVLTGDRTAVSANVNDRLAAAGLVGGGASGTHFAVFNRPLNTSAYLCSGATGSDTAIIYDFVAGLLEWFNNPDRQTLKNTPDAGYHVTTVRQTNGATLVGRYDGAVAFNVVPAAAWDGTQYVGGYAAAGNAWGGGLAEFIQYNRELSDAECLQVERYLGARYGIAVA